MSNRRIWIALSGLALILCAGSAFAANSLDVNANAALAGSNFGLEVIVDGSPNSAFVEDLTPDAETVYRGEFRSNPNSAGLTMADGEFFMVFMGRGNGGVNIIRLALVRKNNEFKIVCRMKKDGPGTAFCGKFTMGPAGTRVGFEWVTASAPGANDGEFRLLKNGDVKFERTDYDNDTLTISAARLGMAKANSIAGSSGSLYLDDFASFRTLAP